jgi:DegV family protein with EDD domain
MSKYVIITETGGDCPADFVSRYGIKLVPMHVTFDGVSKDDGTFPTTDIYQHYNDTKELPKTSGCTPGDFVKVFQEIDEIAPDAEIIYLAYSAVTTCSFESARSVIAGRTDAARFHCFDTKKASGGQFLIVSEIAELLEREPEMPYELLERSINDRIERARMHFIPGGLEFLRAGGRLSNAAFLGAQLLRIKPTIEFIDGYLVGTKKLRGSMQKCVSALIGNFMAQEPKDLRRVVLIRAIDLDPKIQQLAEDKCRAAGFERIDWVYTGGVIASHSGPGSFGICALVK